MILFSSQKPHFTSVLITFLMALQISACTSEDNLAVAATENIDPSVTTDTDTNSYAAIIAGVDSGSITEDLNPDSTNMLTVSGKLDITDSNPGEAAFIEKTVTGNNGSLTMNTAGNWIYSANNSQAVIQNLATGATLTDRMIVNSVDGTAHTIKITINGIDEPNHPALITGIDRGSVTEDLGNNGLLVANGILKITDSDAGETAFIAKTVYGNYGKIYIATTGNWYYVADNNQAVIQNLATGAKLTDNLVVSSVDDTTHTVVITINGVDEPSPAVITGVDSGSVTEDFDSNNDGLLGASGKLNISDSDAGEAAFIATTVSSTYGSIKIDTSGSWLYGAINSLSVIQNLNTNDTLTDRLTISSVDGTRHTVVITINGVDEPPVDEQPTPAVIAGTDTGSITEDVDPDDNNLLETSGTLTITDINPGEAAFSTITGTGTYGSLTIDTAGNWRYAADNRQAAIQNLATGATLTDNLIVSSVDGTAHKVVITIRGVNEASPFAMYSYNANLSNAQPLSGAVLEQATVYMFFNNTSQYSSMIFYCCKGIDGASTGEAHKTPVRDSSAPFIHSVDLSQYSTAGTRELYIDATRTDGSGLDSIYVNFSINTSIVPIIPTPEPSPNSPAVISGVNTASVTEDIDPDGDSLLEVSGILNITDSDAGEAAFIAKTVKGNYGSSLTIDTAGNWNYAADNNQAVIQNLVSGATLTDSLTISSVDGTTHTVTIIIFGANENNSTADITLSWVAPAEREDNSGILLSEIAGYKIYYGTTQGQYSDSVPINDGTATGYTFTGLPAGTYYFVVTTIDTEERESQHSSVVTITI